MKVGQRIAFLLFVLGVNACGEKVGRPLPEPPALAPIDPLAVAPDLDPAGAAPAGTVALVGAAGALVERATLRVINLNTAQIVDIAPPAPTTDGGFSVQLQASEGDWLRFEQSLDGARSAPTDLRLPLSAVDRPSCVSFSGAPYVSFEENAWSAILTNSCEEELTVESVVLSRESAELEVSSEPAAPPEQILSAGDVLELSLQKAVSGAVTEDNVVLVVVRLGAEQIPYASVVPSAP